MLYSFLLPIGRFITWFFGGLRIYNRHLIPKDGPCMLVGNHISAWDPILVACASKDRHLNFMGKAELFRNPLLRWFFLTLGGFPIKRGETDVGAIKTALTRLKAGCVMIIFPEGTRYKDVSEMQEARAGAAMLTLRSNAALVPLAIFGRFRLFRHTHLVIGQPIDILPYQSVKDGGQVDGKADIHGLTERILQEIHALQQAGIPKKIEN